MPSTVTDRIDGLTTSVAVKAPCRVVSSTNVALSSLQTVNGVALAEGDRVLLIGQTSSVNNGIWVASATAWVRARDFDGARDVVYGTLVPTSSSTGVETVYRCTTANPIVIGSSALTFAESVFIASDANAVSFTQLGTGAVTRTVRDKLRDTVSIKDFGAVCDDITDDTAAIQAAIDSVGDTTATARAGCEILIPGPCRITNTLTIRRKGIALVGNGWGYRDDTGTRRSYLRWDGVAGIPMVKYGDCFAGAGMRRLKLMGKVGANPSAAIEINETNDGVANQQLLFEQVYIGPLSGETGAGIQFVDGFQATGVNLNNAEMRINGCYITNISGKGVRQSGTQQVNWKIDHLTVITAGTGVYACGHIQGSNWNFGACGIDIEQPFTDAGGSQTNCLINVLNYYSENAGRMADIQGVSRIIITGGSFQVTSSLNADGKAFKHEGNLSLLLDISGLRITQASAPPASPYFSLRAGVGGATEKTIILDSITGWEVMTGGNNGLDVATRGPTDRRYIRFRECPQSAKGYPLRLAQNFLSGTDVDWDISHFQTRGDNSLRWFDDFLGDSVDARWHCLLGTDGACVTASISSGAPRGGQSYMSTGANAGGTMALNGAQLDLGITNFYTSNGMAVEARVFMSAITNIAYFVGFTDQVAVLEMPFTLAAGDILTSNATDAVGWLFDTGADTDNWWLVGVANNVDATKQNAATAPVAFAPEILRVEVDSAGNANFFRNGSKVGTQMTLAVTPGVNLTPVIAAFSRAAASRDVFADYVLIDSTR